MRLQRKKEAAHQNPRYVRLRGVDIIPLERKSLTMYTFRSQYRRFKSRKLTSMSIGMQRGLWSLTIGTNIMIIGFLFSAEPKRKESFFTNKHLAGVRYFDIFLNDYHIKTKGTLDDPRTQLPDSVNAKIMPRHHSFWSRKKMVYQIQISSEQNLSFGYSKKLLDSSITLYSASAHFL